MNRQKQPRPCRCDRIPPPGQPWTAAFCSECTLFHRKPKYRELWSEDEGSGAMAAAPATVATVAKQPPPKRPPPRGLSCRHLGPQTGERVPCGDGKACKKIVYACAVRGECVLEGKAAGKGCCADCGLYAPAVSGRGGGAEAGNGDGVQEGLSGEPPQ